MNSPASGEFEALLQHLKETRGFDFIAYKRSTLMRRVQKRMAAVHVESFTDYLDYLEVDQDEFRNLFNTILINVTSFFRDQLAWDYLSEEVVPRILEARSGDESIRVWSAGCASGEEAYSIAMVFAEAMGQEAFRNRVKIYATDIDEDALVTARQAMYTAREVQAVASDLRERYFERTGDKYAFRKEFRRAVIFGRHDLLQDAPISRIDLLSSRNTLMYFNSDAQTRILARFSYALREGGYLFLGKAETLRAHTTPFATVELKHRLFAKPPVRDGESRERLQPASFFDGDSDVLERDGDRLRDLAFQADPTAQLAVDTSMNLLLANDRARELFGIRSQEIGRPLQDLEVSYRPVELRSLIARVLADQRATTLSEVYYPSGGGLDRWFDVHLIPMLADRTNLGVKISFLDVTVARQLSEELQKSRGDLETAYEELQSSNEELETTNEELQSTVEELETTNEELQSTNEELETMNEELQSTNEELEAVNDELRERGVQLNEANAFLEGILTGLRSAVAVIDHDLRVKSWNRRAEELWGLRAEEARDQHLVNLDIGLSFDTLMPAIRDCLAGRVNEYETVAPATNRRGRSIACRVRLSVMREGTAPQGEAQTLGAIILMDELEEGT